MIRRPQEAWPTLTPFGDHSVEVVVAALDVTAEAVHRLALLLSEDERQRAGRFAFEKGWRRFVVARGRLRELLAQRLDVRPEAIEFTYGRRGKPALAQSLCSDGLHFNVAHSGELAVYAFGRGGEVGVDVEAVRILPDADAIAARFFSPREREAYAALDSCHKPAGFFNCWTRKEAYIKALGDGLFHPLEGFDVSLAPGEPARILRIADTPGDRCGWRLAGFIPAPGYIGALVAGETSVPACCATAVSSAPALP